MNEVLEKSKCIDFKNSFFWKEILEGLKSLVEEVTNGTNSSENELDKGNDKEADKGIDKITITDSGKGEAQQEITSSSIKSESDGKSETITFTKSKSTEESTSKLDKSEARVRSLIFFF